LYNKEGEDQGEEYSYDDVYRKMQYDKRKAAKEAAKAMEQSLPVLVARMENERLAAAAAAEAKAAAEVNGSGKRIYTEGQAAPGESSKRARYSQEHDATVTAGAKAAAPPILPPTKASLTERPKSYVGQRVGKFFDDECFFGDIDSYDKKNKLWRVVYDDGDEEDFDAKEVIKYRKVYEENKQQDVNREEPTTRGVC
jgi:hypothetical protein